MVEVLRGFLIWKFRAAQRKWSFVIRIETTWDTDSISIDRMKDDGDFAMKSVEFPFSLSVSIREIRGSSSWNN